MTHHWATPLIGLPYRSAASGPNEFDCLGLVRYYFKERHGIALPDYGVEQGFAKLLEFTRATGWHRATGSPQDEDLMLMENSIGRHIGIVILANFQLGLLHAQGNDQAGSVVWQPLDSLWGYRNKELWRHV